MRRFRKAKTEGATPFWGLKLPVKNIFYKIFVLKYALYDCLLGLPKAINSTGNEGVFFYGCASSDF
jgi:hypothetical protein